MRSFADAQDDNINGWMTIKGEMTCDEQSDYGKEGPFVGDVDEILRFAQDDNINDWMAK